MRVPLLRRSRPWRDVMRDAWNFHPHPTVLFQRASSDIYEMDDLSQWFLLPRLLPVINFLLKLFASLFRILYSAENTHNILGRQGQSKHTASRVFLKNSVMATSTSSEGILAQCCRDHHCLHDMNRTSDDQHLVFFQEIQNTTSMSSDSIASDRGLNSTVEAPSSGQLLVHGQPSSVPHLRATIQAKDRGQVVNVALDPRQITNPDLPIPHQHPTAEDWEAYRHIFTQLYIVENRTLREVEAIMKEQYQFQARLVLFIKTCPVYFFFSGKVTDHLSVKKCLRTGSKSGDSARTIQQQNENFWPK